MQVNYPVVLPYFTVFRIWTTVFTVEIMLTNTQYLTIGMELFVFQQKLAVITY